jgi:hypothetical protein
MRKLQYRLSIHLSSSNFGLCLCIAGPSQYEFSGISGCSVDDISADLFALRDGGFASLPLVKWDLPNLFRLVW